MNGEIFMQKKALLALMLAATLLLSSCALVVKDAAVDAQTVIIRKGDTTVTKGEVQKAVLDQLNYTAYMYSMYGMSYDPTDAANIATAQSSAISALEEDIVTKEHIASDLEALTEEQLAEVQETAQSNFDADIEAVKSYQFADSELEGDALTEAAKAWMDEQGMTLDAYVQNAIESKQRELLRELVIKDVEVTEEDFLAEYNSRVESAKTSYEGNPASYATAVNNGSTVYYAPEGVRRVKQILTKFHDDDQTAINDANAKVTSANSAVTAANAKITSAQEILDTENAPEEDKAQAQTDLDAANAELETANADLAAAQSELEAARETAFANIEEETDAILAELADGADWDTLMAEKNQDPGMKSGTTAEKGYAVAADMTSFDSAFVEAAMGLENIGDVSGKIRGDAYGYYIIKYIGDEPVGEIGPEAVRETLTSSLLSTKQSTFYNDTLAQWVEDAKFQVDLNALKD